MKKFLDYLVVATVIVCVVIGTREYIEYDANTRESVWGIENEEWETYVSENGFVRSRPVPWWRSSKGE